MGLAPQHSLPRPRATNLGTLHFLRGGDPLAIALKLFVKIANTSTTITYYNIYYRLGLVAAARYHAWRHEAEVRRARKRRQALRGQSRSDVLVLVHCLHPARVITRGGIVPVDDCWSAGGGGCSCL